MMASNLKEDIPLSVTGKQKSKEGCYCYCLLCKNAWLCEYGLMENPLIFVCCMSLTYCEDNCLCFVFQGHAILRKCHTAQPELTNSSLAVKIIFFLLTFYKDFPVFVMLRNL